mgnify:CR=1 FL=1
MSDAKTPRDAASQAEDALEAGAAVEAEVPEKLSVKANMIWNSIGSMTYLACQWFTTIFVVRLSSGYDDAGLLSLAMSVVGIFGTFANYKMGTYQISDIRRENTVGEYMGFRCFTLAGAFVACMIYAALTCAPEALITVALFYAFKGVGLVIDILHGVDQINRRMDYIGKSFILQGTSTLVAFVVVYWATRNLDAAIVAMLVAAAVVLFAFDLPHCQRFEPVRLSLSRKKALFFLKTSLPAVIASVAASAIFAIPKQYLALTVGSAALGIYSSVAAPALVIQMGAQYLYGPLLDIFPKLFFEGNVRGFGEDGCGHRGRHSCLRDCARVHRRLGARAAVRREHRALRLPAAADYRVDCRHRVSVVLRRPAHYAAPFLGELRGQRRRVSRRYPAHVFMRG